MNSTHGTVTSPQPGRLYRYNTSDNLQNSSYLMFVTKVEVSEHVWSVTGYRVKESSYVLTDDEVSEYGPVGHPYGVPHEAFCAPLGVGPECGLEQLPLFCDRFPASDYSSVRAAERTGRTRHMADA